jgi:hypothetical protein
VKSLGILERLGDLPNPIVVKELRQAVRSKFIVGVLLFFLLVQVSYLGISLVVWSNEGRLDAADFEAGRLAFGVIQGIMLATCMLFIPAYTGVRLAAERSDVNVDLLFITTLRPRAIISGKLLAALVLTVLIFSSCAPFMTFTYLLRGIDVPSILWVLGIDFAGVALAVQLAIFLAVASPNRVFKVILGLLGLIGLVFAVWGVMAGSLALLEVGAATMLDSPNFWPIAEVIAATALTLFGLLFTWSVGLVTPRSANRAWGGRLFVVAVWLGTGVVFGAANVQVPEAHGGPLFGWLYFMTGLFSLGLMIEVNEPEQWGPRVARTIPRRWWLRGPAFLFYSGAAGGIMFAVLMICLTGLVALVWREVAPSLAGRWKGGRWEFPVHLKAIALIGIYTYCYALTAVLVRRVSPFKIPAAYTWIVLLILLALGSTVPYLTSFLLFGREWRYETHFYWLLSTPFAAVADVIGWRAEHFAVFLTFASAWAGLVTLLSLPWYGRQLRGFRPYAGRGAAPGTGELPLTVTAAQAATTKTVEKPAVEAGSGSGEPKN